MKLFWCDLKWPYLWVIGWRLCFSSYGHLQISSVQKVYWDELVIRIKLKNENKLLARIETNTLNKVKKLNNNQMKNKKYHTVRTVLKYHTVRTVPKYHTVRTVLKYHTVRTVLKYHTVRTVLKYHTVRTVLKSNWQIVQT